MYSYLNHFCVHSLHIPFQITFLVNKILIVMKSFCCGQSIVLLDRNLKQQTYVYYKYLMSNIKPFQWLDLPHLICKEIKAMAMHLLLATETIDIFLF